MRKTGYVTGNDIPSCQAYIGVQTSYQRGRASTKWTRVGEKSRVCNG